MLQWLEGNAGLVQNCQQRSGIRKGLEGSLLGRRTACAVAGVAIRRSNCTLMGHASTSDTARNNSHKRKQRWNIFGVNAHIGRTVAGQGPRSNIGTIDIEEGMEKPRRGHGEAKGSAWARMSKRTPGLLD